MIICLRQPHSLLRRFHRPAANSSAFRVAPMTVQRGDWILDDSVLLEVPAVGLTNPMVVVQIDGGVLCCICTEELAQGQQDYGPRMIVTKKRAVAYTGLLPPQAMRKLEVWSIYQFICCCARCRDLHPFTYVDHALQEIDVVSCASSGTCSHYKFFIYKHGSIKVPFSW